MTHHQHQHDATASSGGTVFFQQGCPVCGRRLEIAVGLLGRRVFCQHCGGGFVAMDPSLAGEADAAATPDRVSALLKQAEFVLEQAAAEGDAG